MAVDVVLRPDPAASRSYADATDVLVVGDNLDVLRLLRPAYDGVVRLVYLDPPYNTGSDHVYADNFGARGDDWVAMMRPRLLLARELLRTDGVLMVHIDEHELVRLVLLLEEVLGADNRLGEVVWDKRNPKGDARGISSQHEYVVVWARDRDVFLDGGGFRRPKASAEEILRMAGLFWASVGTTQLPADLADALRRHGVSGEAAAHLAVEVTPQVARRQFASWLRAQPFTGGELAYRWLDDDGEVYRLVSMAWPNKRRPSDDYFVPLRHPVTGRECPVPARGWRNSSATMRRLLDEGLLVFGPDETRQPQRKYLLRDHMTTGLASVVPWGGSDDRLLAAMGVPFDTPKPVGLVRQLVAACTSGDDVVLDFFAGSGTTAHAVALQNDLDGGARRTVSVNLAEPVSPTSDAARAGFRTVAELTVRRLQAVVDLVASARGLRVLEVVPRATAGPAALATADLLADGVRLDDPGMAVALTGVVPGTMVGESADRGGRQ